ncbi:MAG: T9SS type A sorting domain-containing protein [Bacteroidia bacterium]|nr:T9SS type A sorting domain-containing protein [Bacteroidia bacterium]
MKSVTTPEWGRRVTSSLPIIFVIVCTLFSSTALAQTRYWEVLTLFGGKGDATVVKVMLYDTKRDQVIIAGSTEERDLPVTPDAIKTQFTDGMDGYIAVFNADCSELIYCSYIGGMRFDGVADIIRLDEDRLLVAVNTPSRDLPVTGTAWSAVPPSGSDDFVWLAVLSLESFELLHAGYFGGNTFDAIAKVIRMRNGDIVMTGWTESTDLPVTPDAFQSRKLGRPDHGDAWIAVFDTALVLTFCSYHGGAGDYDNAEGALTETEDYIVFTGWTWSPDLPVTENAYQKTFADGGRGWWDAYLTIISKEDKRNVYTTYLGGSDSEGIGDIIVADDDRIVLMGATSSPDFPVTPDAWQSVLNESSGKGASNIIVAVFSLRDMRFEHVTFIGGGGGDGANAGIYDQDRDAVRILATSGSTEFPFLQPKPSNMPDRGVLLDFDVSSGTPIGAIPVLDLRVSYMRKLITTTSGRMLFTGTMGYDAKVDTLPVRSTAHRSVITGIRDVFIGEIYNKPVSLEALADPDNVSGTLRILNNPASNELRFVIEGAVPEASRAQLYDLLGRRVAEAPLLYNGRNAHGSMQIQGLAPGLYLLAIPGADGVRSAKVMVTK